MTKTKIKAKKNILSKSSKKAQKKPAAVKIRRKETQPVTSDKKSHLSSKKHHELSEQLRDAALKILDARKAEDVTTFDLRRKSSEADFLIIASANASRQVTAIAHYLKDAFQKLNVRQIRMEGLPQANWVLVDAGDVIVHIFRPEVRQYYNLESIWGDAKIGKRRKRG